MCRSFLEGYFDRKAGTSLRREGEAVPHGQFIIMHIENTHVRFFVNDALVYAFGEPGTYPDFARSPGNLWDSVVSPGITPEDRVRLELSNC